MLVQQLILDNIEEIIQADKMGLEAPKDMLISRKMIINGNDILLAYVNRENNIEILIYGQFFEIKYTEIIWETIEKTINARKQSK